MTATKRVFKRIALQHDLYFLAFKVNAATKFFYGYVHHTLVNLHKSLKAMSGTQIIVFIFKTLENVI